ncbi:unnamed protein product [Scytosiphon promiscuus]
METATFDDESTSQRRHAPAFEKTHVKEDEVATLMQISRKLCLVEDPSTEPFRSKYKAREALTKARQLEVGALEAGRSGSGGEDAGSTAAAAGRVALIDYGLGVIALAVEENSAAQEALDKCADVFFEGVVGKVAAAAGNEDEEKDDDQGDGINPDSLPPPPIPTAVPPGMLSLRPLARDHPEEAADTLTQLGLLWSRWGHSRRSILYLLAAVAFLRQASSLSPTGSSESSSPPASAPAEAKGEAREGEKSGGTQAEGVETKGGDEEGSIPAAAGGGGGSGDGGGGAVAATTAAAGGGRNEQEGAEEATNGKLESMLTHALYYLAQAFGVQDVEQSAKYCALTLKRQLDASQRGDGAKVSFDPGEWSRNACFLADYYSGLERFAEAGRCLLAAQAVLAPQEKKQALNADGGVASVSRAQEARAALSGNSGSPLAPRPPPPPPPPSPSPGGKQDGAEMGSSEDAGEKAQEQKTEGDEAKGEGGSKAQHQQSDGKTAAKEEDEKEDDDGGGRKEKGEDANEGAEEKGHDEEVETQEEKEQRVEQRADVNRHMAKLYITVLQAKYQERGRQGGGEFSRVRSQEAGEEENEGQKDDLGSGLGFASLGIGELPMCDPSDVPSDFESVRNVFKKAKSHTDRALQHYVLDGFVTAHVALQQGVSRAYLYLSAFERDTKRKQAMCTRRAQALEPLLNALAPKAYARLHKEMSFELGEIYQDLADIKILRVEEKIASGVARGPSALASDLRATNKLLKSAIGFFSHFVAMYHEGDPRSGAADSPSQPAQGLEAAEAVGYLQARFMRARLNGKLQPLTSETELKALRLSCAEFGWLSEHAREHLKAAREAAGDPSVFEQELGLAEEMAQLQRRNIANLERKSKDQQQ